MCCFSLHLSYYCLYLQLAFIGECDIGGSIGCTDRPVNLWTRNDMNIFIILISYYLNISFHIHRQADTPLNSADRIGALVQTYWLEEKSQFLIRSVWQKILTWCNKLSFIQKYQLKRTSKDETRKRNHKNLFTQPLSFDIEINIIEILSVSKIGIMNHNVIQDIVYIKHANANVKYFGMAIPFKLEMWNRLFFFSTIKRLYKTVQNV